MTLRNNDRKWKEFAMQKAAEMRDWVKNWCRQLRIGNYKQTHNALADEYGYCCLGVLCAIEGLGRRPSRYADRYFFSYNGDEDSGVLPETFAESLNFQRSGGFFIELLDGGNMGYDLSSLNDEGFTFKQIADVIEYVEKWNHWSC